MKTVSVTNTTRSKNPRGEWQAMKDDILGKEYELSLVFVGGVRAQKLNEAYRGKSYVPNVLSFPFDAKTGEIYIAPAVAKKEAQKFDLSVTGYIQYLYIHGLLHLKGMDHGGTMDKAEIKYRTKYKVH